jgi:hypothetical protein
MRKVYLTSISIFMGFFTSGQDLTYEQVDSLTNSRITQLLQEQDSILLHESGCIGCYFVSDNGCNCEQYNYLYWSSSTDCMVQKIDCCGTHETLMVEKNIWNKFESEVHEILSSEFKTEYYVTHHFFDFLSLVTQDTTLTIKIHDYYFNSEDSVANMNQPAKKFLDFLTTGSN